MAQEASGGIGFLGALALLFIGLKLGNIIQWSWWWVLLPLYFPFAVIGVFLFGIGVLYTLAAIADWISIGWTKLTKKN